MSSPPAEISLHALGTEIFEKFKRLVHESSDKSLSENYLSRVRLINEEERFLLWAHNLGLHQTGHVSLDYRLRAAIVVKDYVSEVLTEIKQNLDEMLSIVLGERQPYNSKGGSSYNPEDLSGETTNQSDVAEQPESDRQDSAEPDENHSLASSGSSFHEMVFRLSSITERTDALFSLAVKIRNPKYRPTLPTIELYRHIPSAQRVEYMREREQCETAIVAYVLQQQLAEALKTVDIDQVDTPWRELRSKKGKLYYHNKVTKETQWDKPSEFSTLKERILASQPWRERTSKRYLDQNYYFNSQTWESVWEMPQQYREALDRADMTPEALIGAYARPDHWLVQRTGIANARRKQQFVYWKEHAALIGRPVLVEPAPSAFERKALGKKVVANLASPALSITMETQSATSRGLTLATSATRLEPDALKPEDLKSVISHQSRVSTILGPQGDKIEWPSPPISLMGEKFFRCPYCKTLCPQTYLSQDAWRVHLINDLQPYHCTYPDCTDRHRLYGNRKEWLIHENQHRRVWRCAVDQKEFETQPEYISHLESEHKDNIDEMGTPELVAAAVTASLYPHRDCPFCPLAFQDVTQMHKHVTYHLERLALFALPGIDEEGDEDEDRSERSSDSKQAIPQKRGRQASLIVDFGGQDKLGLSEDYGEGERVFDDDPIPTGPGLQEIRDEPSFELSNPTLEHYVEDWLRRQAETAERSLSTPSWYLQAADPQQSEWADDESDEVGSVEDKARSLHLEPYNPGSPPPAPTREWFPDLPFPRD